MAIATNVSLIPFGKTGDVVDRNRVPSEQALAALALAVGAGPIWDFTDRETSLLDDATDVSDDLVTATVHSIEQGGDPLGEIFCQLRSSEERRHDGAVYTPAPIVDSMLAWAEHAGQPDRVIDPGSGSGRFLIEAGRTFPEAHLIGIERDPLAALVSRANLAVAGMSSRSEIRVENFLTSELTGSSGKTLFVGNPPYVRHHVIHPEWKRWLKDRASEMGIQASALAGLHVYFFLKVAAEAKSGDYGAFITASEWLDVNYGRLVRDLFLDRLGGESVFVIEPNAEPFPGIATTGAITSFKVSSNLPSARFARVAQLSDLRDLSGGRRVSRERLVAEKRWSHFTRTQPQTPEGYVELGELCRVHRGQVTGANRVWIAGKHSADLPKSVLFPTVTRAKELFQSGPVLSDSAELKRVIDLPEDLSALTTGSLRAVQRFLIQAEEMGAKSSYTAQNRRSWWSVRLRDPAPVLATYMARRAPAFVLNEANARHLNVAHGLYPREELDSALLFALVLFLRGSSPMHVGRVYAGGLTKFEPREMERIPVPDLNMLKETIVRRPHQFGPSNNLMMNAGRHSSNLGAAGSPNR